MLKADGSPQEAGKRNRSMSAVTVLLSIMALAQGKDRLIRYTRPRNLRKTKKNAL